jgi:hypothetical protein
MASAYAQTARNADSLYTNLVESNKQGAKAYYKLVLVFRHVGVFALWVSGDNPHSF